MKKNIFNSEKGFPSFFVYALFILSATALVSAAIFLGNTIGMNQSLKNAEKESLSINSNGYEFGLIQTENGINPMIIYDKDTGTMYMVSESGNYQLMVDEDGKPRIFNEVEE